MTIFYCLPALWELLAGYGSCFIYIALLGMDYETNTSDSPTTAVCVFVAMEMCLDQLLYSSGHLCNTSLTLEL
jgi:hypothetical protein